MRLFWPIAPSGSSLTSVAATLGTRLSQRDSHRLVGRDSQLAAFDELFVEDPPASVVFLHGPGGIGKSTLLREVARRGERRGWRATFVEGRELAPVPDALEQAVGAARHHERPLLLLDSYERMRAMGGYLRRDLLRSLPERTIVVIAGRGSPERAWFEGGWESLMLDVELGPLSEQESMDLLRSHGVAERRIAAELVAWAEGSPLALVLGADTVGQSRGWSPHNAIERPRMVQSLIRRLADTEIDAAHVGALGVAATARVTTVDLLRDVLPEVDPVAAFDWLESRSFAEPLGDGVTLHELVRKAMHADLRLRDAERERELRRRIADHLYRRAIAGSLLLSIDLAHLVESEAIRWGYSWEGSVHHRIDDLGPGDSETIERLLTEWGHGEWFHQSQPFFSQAPQRVAVARDPEDRLCGYQVAVTPHNAPSFAEQHSLLGPWLGHARARPGGGEAIIWSASIDFTGNPRSRVQAMLGMAGVLRSGLDNPRFAYLPVNPHLPGALEFSAAMGAEHLSELDREVAGVRVECHVIDYGPGGLLGAQRDVVYAELGLAPPRPAPPSGRGAIADEAVREALRNFQLPHKLAASELARGEGTEERAASVRLLLEEAAERAFGESDDERLLREVLVRGYLKRAPSQESAADELHLSRSSYFRRLKAAAYRVAEYVRARDPA
jgi:AAA ATPase domain